MSVRVADSDAPQHATLRSQSTGVAPSAGMRLSIVMRVLGLVDPVTFGGRVSRQP